MKMMNATARELSEELRRSLEQLKTLKDEIRLEAHLAGMDMKKQWTEELEPLLAIAEDSVQRASASARGQVNDTLARWRTFYEAVVAKRPTTAGPRAPRADNHAPTHSK